MSSSYDIRGMKLSCALNWSKQTLRVRLDQSFLGYVIEIKEKFKLEFGVLSRMQVLDFAERYMNEVVNVMSQMQKDGTIQIEEDKGEEK